MTPPVPSRTEPDKGGSPANAVHAVRTRLGRASHEPSAGA